MERIVVEAAKWRMPARLVRSTPIAADPTRHGTAVELAHGQLVEMVRLAAEVDEAEGLLLSIDRVDDRPMSWAEIRAMRDEPTFPIDI